MRTAYAAIAEPTLAPKRLANFSARFSFCVNSTMSSAFTTSASGSRASRCAQAMLDQPRMGQRRAKHGNNEQA